jgi:3-hydroxyisobutyrate dehydrogenase-like beta-hydroxyacid dehydrogenase
MRMVNGSPVGIVGIGLMGEVLARRLRDAGFEVIGYDIDANKNARLDALGAHAAQSIAQLAERCPTVVLSVFDTGQVEQVVERELAPVIAENAVVLCTSTCDPDRIAALAQRLTRIRFLETPVSGTSEQVRRGEGVGLIGGDARTVAEAEPLIRALFPKYFHIGKVGDGGRAKLAVNLVLGLNRLALAEGLVFAERLGLDPAAFLEVAKGSAAYSQVMETKGRKMVAREFAPEGRIRQTLKDVHLMLDQAKAAGQPLPLLQVHARVLEACLRSGEGELDNSAVVEEIRRQMLR